MKKKKRKGVWKQPVASVLGMGLVVGLTIVGTLAFMQTESNTKSNVFTGTNDIKLYLEEPEYNLREIKVNGNIIEATKDPNKLDPREYVPGVTYPKDPTLYNITGQQTKKADANQTELAEEWVALRVDYKINDVPVSYGQLTHSCDGRLSSTEGTSNTCSDTNANKKCDYVENNGAGIIEDITFDIDVTNNGNVTTGNWIRLTSTNCNNINNDNKYEIYVYKYKLKAENGFDDDDIITAEEYTSMDAMNNMDNLLNGKNASAKGNEKAATTPLFPNITIKDQEQLIKNGYQISDLKKFSIELTGAAIKVMPTINVDEIDATKINTNNEASKLIVEDLVSLLQQ